MKTVPKTAQELMAGCQGLVHSLAWKIHQKLPRHVDLDDLIGYGQVGLAEAARDFDSTKGHQFTTFAYHRVRGAILDGLSKMAWFSRSRYYRGDYEKLSGEVLREAEGEPGSADASPVETDVRWLKDLGGALAMVYMFCQGSEGRSDANVLEDSALSPSSIMIKRETQEKLKELVDALPEQAAGLIRAAYFEGLSLKDAGERLGISRAWASRLHAQTLRKLAQTLQQAALAD